MVSRAPTYSHACSLHSSRLCLGIRRCPGVLPGQLTWLLTIGKWWNKWHMMREIKYTHQEAQGTPKNADKQSNPGKEYEQNKIEKWLFIIIAFSVWFPWVLVDTHGLSLVAAGGHCSSCGQQASLRGLLLLRSTGSRCTGVSSCSMPAPIGSLQVPQHRVVVPRLWVAPQNEFSFLFFIFFCTETEITKTEANKEFADGLVVRIRCFHCCACILSWSGNCAMRQKQRSLKLCNEAIKEKEPNRNYVA